MKKITLLKITSMGLLLLLLLSCTKINNKPITVAKPNTSNVTKTLSSSTSVNGDMESTSPIGVISKKDIFTPPDMKIIFQVPTTNIIPEVVYEPQKLTVTGIVFDGSDYMVSVENSDTNGKNYLKEKDKIADYSITSIFFDHFMAQQKKKVKNFIVGDQIPLPGTRGQAVSSLASSPEISSANLTTDTTGEKTAESAVSITPAANSLEEMLIKRRQKEEEDLKK